MDNCAEFLRVSGLIGYCAFHANSKVQKPPSQLRFWLPSIIITITSNEPRNTKTHKTDRNPPITNHKPRPFESVKVKFSFLRGPIRWLTAAKNAIVRWLLNFKIRMFVKSAVMAHSGWTHWVAKFNVICGPTEAADWKYCAPPSTPPPPPRTAPHENKRGRR